MSMDKVFSPDARKWVSPLFHMKDRIKQMQQVRSEFLGPVDRLWETMLLLSGGADTEEEVTNAPEMTDEEKAADKARRILIFGEKTEKGKKKAKGGPGGKRGKGRKRKGATVESAEKKDTEADLDYLSALIEEGEEIELIPSDPEDYIMMQAESDGEDEYPTAYVDSERESSDSDDDFENPLDSDEEFDYSAFKKMQEELQPNAALLAEQDEKNFALHYKYCQMRARTLDQRALEKEKTYLQTYFGFNEDKLNEMWRLASPNLATTKAEVIVDDVIFKGNEMPLLAGAIPSLAVKKLSSLALYTTLSDEPGNFQWRMVNVVDQLTNDLKYSKHSMRARQLGKLGPHDVVSNAPEEAVLTVTMYQRYDIPEGDHFYDLKTSQEPKLGMVVEILASQTLLDLVKKLKCQTDFMCSTDMTSTFSTENADSVLARLETDMSYSLYKSRLVYIHDTIYTEGGQDSRDFVKNLNKWVEQAPPKDIRLFKRSLLKTAKLKDLNLRFGFPYLYLHQGSCEHVIVFNTLRTVRRVDHAEFPRYEKMGKYPTKYCRVDNENLARWAVVGYDRVPEDPMLLCSDCVNHYCFLNGARVGEFKLFPFLQFLHYA